MNSNEDKDILSQALTVIDLLLRAFDNANVRRILGREFDHKLVDYVRGFISEQESIKKKEKLDHDWERFLKSLPQETKVAKTEQDALKWTDKQIDEFISAAVWHSYVNGGFNHQSIRDLFHDACERNSAQGDKDDEA